MTLVRAMPISTLTAVEPPISSVEWRMSRYELALRGCGAFGLVSAVVAVTGMAAAPVHSTSCADAGVGNPHASHALASADTTRC